MTEVAGRRSTGACRLFPRGDGHPVLVLPGFTADDVSTAPLRFVLQRHGLDAHGWHLGRNVGPTRRIVEGMRRRLDEMHSEHGRAVSLVGWSLGGMYARELARERPDAVRQVITLGSPYRTTEGDSSAATPLWRQVEHRHVHVDGLQGAREQDRAALTVPATSIYTRDDGIVRWQLCIDESGPDAPNPRAENVEVYGTHIGLGINPTVIGVVLDRLLQREATWHPFQPPLVAKPWYPRPASWSPRRAA